MPQTNRAADDTAGSASDDAARVAAVKLWSDGFLQSMISKGKDESWQVDIPQREVCMSVFDHRASFSVRQAESSLESSHIADVLAELRDIPQREAGGEQLDARVTELIDELEEHLAKLEEEKNRLLEVAFGRR